MQNKDRIVVDVSNNRPDSKAAFEKYPPDKYPIEMFLMFSNRDAHLVDTLKSVLNKQSSSESRYKKTVAKHVGNSISLRCYFRDIDALRPIAWTLKDQNIWRDTLQYESNKLTPRMLIERAEAILKKEISTSI